MIDLVFFKLFKVFEIYLNFERSFLRIYNYCLNYTYRHDATIKQKTGFQCKYHIFSYGLWLTLPILVYM